MKKDAIIIINAGSSSLKFKLFHKNNLLEFSYGQITGIGTEKIKMIIKDTLQAKTLKEELLDTSLSRDDILVTLINTLVSLYLDMQIIAAGHRVVHGGDKYLKPTLITSQVIQDLKHIQDLSPIHLPHNIRPMEVLIAKFPNIKQIACFDTSFHATNPMFTRLYGIPKELSQDSKIIRYGFHGISYNYISEYLKNNHKDLYNGKVVICHLGAGASLCALMEGKSYTTTMGFTPLQGLVMGSRCGDIDPGILLYLIKYKNYTHKDLEDLLYYKSGVLGLSSISSDFYTLERSTDPKAAEALHVYNHNLAKAVGAMMASMAGLDAIIFTAGVGENAQLTRKYIADSFSFLGVSFDDDANNAKAEIITKPDSKIKMLIIPTNEELMIAKETATYL